VVPAIFGAENTPTATAVFTGKMAPQVDHRGLTFIFCNRTDSLHRQTLQIVIKAVPILARLRQDHKTVSTDYFHYPLPPRKKGEEGETTVTCSFVPPENDATALACSTET
jgi:hypothetical protein